MHGTITFPDLAALAEFLRQFTGSTAVFTVREGARGTWVLEFTGGF